MSATIVVGGPNGPIQASPGATALLGLTGDDLTDADTLAAALEALAGRASNSDELLPILTDAAGDPEWTADDWLWRFDAEPTHLMVSSWPLPGAQGSGRVWTLQDVSAPYHLADAERAQAEAGRRYEEAIARSGIATALVSPPGRFLEVNPAMTRFLERSEDELLAATWMELTHPDDLTFNLADVQEMREGKRDFLEHTKRYLRPDGSYIYGHLTLSALRDSHGVLTGQLAQIMDVDQTVRAEEQAERERSRFQASIEAMLDPQILLAPIRDADGEIVDYVYLEANQAACTYNAMTRDQTVGARLLELFPGIRATEIWSACVAASTHGVPGVLDDFWLHNDLRGRPHYYDIRIIAFGDELSFTWRDVTERHESVQGVLDSEALLRAILDAMPDMFALFSPVRDDDGVIVDFEYVDVNPAWCDFTGRSREQHLGVRVSTTRPNFTSSGAFALAKQVMAEGRPLGFDAYHLVNSKSQVGDAYLAIRAARVGDHLATLLRDVTAQQSAANEVLESERRYRMLAENTSDMVIVSRDGVLDWVSPSTTRVLGWTPEVVVGHRNEEFLHPDDASVMRTLNSTDEIPPGTRLRYRVRDVEGNYHWLDVSAGPLFDPQGVQTGVLASGRVIDEQVQAEQDLISARHTAEVSAAAEATFLANMSHEIRTPLNAILGLLQLLESTTLSPLQEDYADRARNSANFLLGVLESVLDYSKIEADALELHLEPVALAELVGEVGDIVRDAIGNKSLELRTAIDPATPEWVLADGLRLQQVLLNLAANAVKFTGEGTVTLAIDVVGRTAESRLIRVSVADTGIGIDAEALERIFEGFTQAETSTARRFGGTGLGLTISRSLVQLMGSNLEVTSTVGVGSTFAFTVDFALCEPATHVRPAQPRPAAQAPHRLAGLRILLAEDTEINSMIAADLLRRQGAQVVTAADGAATVALATDPDQHFDAILMDIQMPNLDGIEATRRIRIIPWLADLPILALTAHSSLVEQARCIQAGMNAYLSKPFEIDELTSTILRITGPGVKEGSRTHVEPEQSPALDGPAALELLGGDRELYARVLRRFLDQLPALTTTLIAAIRSEDATAAAGVAHSLTGSTATLGANRLNAVATEIEAACRTDLRPSDIEAFVARINAAAAETVHDAQPWL